MSIPGTDNAKIAIASALITAITTILVAFIGVVPQIRRDDRKEIDNLQKTIGEMKTLIEGLKTSREELQSISGMVRNGDNTPKNDAVLYAVKADAAASLDDSGKFVFQNMARSPYWIVMADQNKKVRRLLIRPDDFPSMGTMEGLTMVYKFAKE